MHLGTGTSEGSLTREKTIQFEEANNYFDKPSEKAEIWVPEISAEGAKPRLVELELPLRKLSE